jgi:hypothetical protein
MKIERGPTPGPFAKHTDYKPFLRPVFRCRLRLLSHARLATGRGRRHDR